MAERSFEAVRRILLDRAVARRNPFDRMDPAEARGIVESLRSTDHEPWARAFMAAGAAHAARGEAELAYGCYRMARYPAPNGALKRQAYGLSQEQYLRMAQGFDPPLERVRIPHPGTAIVADLRVSRGARRPPIIVLWGGIDSFKEERRPEPYLARGIATLAIDMPGTGDAPLPGSEDAERMWDPIFDWLAARGDVDGRRVAVGGNSTGGYWAAKLAHTHRERIRAAVDHGGPAHLAFERAWIERAADGEYPFELAETLASAFGLRTREEWIAYAPRLSLLAQGILERPCAPLLLVNGAEDSVFPIADMHLLLAHGDPKTARFFPGGHMGQDPRIADLIADWVRERL